MDKAAQAEQRIKQTCDKLGITHGGRLWLDTALDPFKDIVQKPIGYPDRVMTPSVVQTIHDSITVKAPGAVNWDCNVFLDNIWRQIPLLLTNPTVPTQNAVAFNQSGQGVTQRVRGGMIVRKADSGLPLDMNTTSNADCLSYQTDVFQNETSARIIGIGLEIHNTTAEIEKQGALCTYRISDAPDKGVCQPFIDNATVTRNSVAISSVFAVEPPATLGQAVDLPGSLQWDAKKGAYIVPTFISEENEPEDLRALAVVAKDYTNQNFWVPLIGTDGVTLSFKGTNNSTSCANALLPTGIAGAFLTGLSPQTTLVLNLTYYVEQFPAFASPMHRISSPSCPEDFAAVELYTKVARWMPTGVEVNDNFLANFVSGLARIMRTVARVAPTIARVAKGVQSGSSLVSEILDNINDERPPQLPISIKRDKEVIVNHNNSNNERTVVIHQPPKNSNRRETVEVKNDRQIVVYEPRRNNNNNNNNRDRRPAGITVKNERKKDYNRLDKYIRASNAGNRWV